MGNSLHLRQPDNLDWKSWVDRWDRMQARYLVRRSERFEIIVRLTRETQHSIAAVLDLGCGAGEFGGAGMAGFLLHGGGGRTLSPTLEAVRAA